jgi:Ran GTPase-activating protein (RanGAP) involved in mRNA processing and transport
LEHDSYRDRDGEPIVWHEPILDAYWDQLEARIKQQEIFVDIQHIQIVNVEITKERLATLVTALSGHVNTTKHINFINVNLCQEGILSLSKLVDVSATLQRFSISHNRIDNMDSARCLSRSLKSHTCINWLWLNHCDLGSSPEILSVILQSDVKYIYINNNNIDSLGAITIAEYLEGNPPIKHLFLDRNRLNDDDAILISRALRRNTNLKTINLHSNSFTSIGVKALLNCVFHGSSLNAISESNHTLAEMNFFDYSKRPKSLVSCIDRLLEFNRTQKILLALQDKDSLLQYLANVPVELIPEVLAFPQRQCSWYLNIVYSTMRWWNMPMLYSYQKCSDNMMSDRREKK